jgi:hypothetical protein
MQRRDEEAQNRCSHVPIEKATETAACCAGVQCSHRYGHYKTKQRKAKRPTGNTWEKNVRFIVEFYIYTYIYIYGDYDSNAFLQYMHNCEKQQKF